MTRVRVALGTLVFFLVAPATVAGLIPWWISGWRVDDPFANYAPVRAIGTLVLSTAIVFLAHSFVRFVTEGLGTPAPVAPTERLVIGGVYRYVRNPMYVAVVGAIIGQALIFGQSLLVVYAAIIGALQAAFVRFHEEPALLNRYGREYESYRNAVPGWWPRLRPWSGGHDSHQPSP